VRSGSLTTGVRCPPEDATVARMGTRTHGPQATCAGACRGASLQFRDVWRRVRRNHRGLRQADVAEVPSVAGQVRDDLAVPEYVHRAIDALRSAGVRLEPGLTGQEVETLEREFGFTFGPEHAELLGLALPIGPSWPDWRRGDPEELRGRLEWPIEGVIFDVRSNAFWPVSWGERPSVAAEAERVAREELAAVPRLVPFYGHRCLAADPRYAPSPVFSVHQTDVIYYGDNLVDYVAHEFGGASLQPSERTRVPFWSELAEGFEDRDL